MEPETVKLDTKVSNWLGDGLANSIAESMRRWYGPPIPLALPDGMGRVWVTKGGDFCGAWRSGYYSKLLDYYVGRTARAIKRWARQWATTAGAGFTSLSDLIAKATTGGKSQLLSWTKAGTAGVVGRSNSLFNVGSWPAAGGVGGTTGTGRATTRTTTGALTQKNPVDQLHVTTIPVYQGSVAGQCLLLYDRLWDMTHTMTVDPRSCDAANPPTRYQTAALAPGNFFSGEVTTVLPAATPTITLDYVDQDGNNVTGPALSTIASAAAVNTIPFTLPNWFYPLASTDQGLRSLQNSANAINLSAAMASGVVSWFIGHPLVFMPIPAANTPLIVDGINSAFNLQQVLTDACLCFLELFKSATGATNHWGAIQLVET